MSRSTIFASLGLALTLACTATPLRAQTAPEDLHDEVMAIGKIMFTGKDATRCKPVDTRLDRLAADPRFGTMPREEQRLALMMLLACSPMQTPRAVAAAARLAPITTDPGEVRIANMTLLFDAQSRQDAKAFAGAVGRIVDSDPEVLAGIDPMAFGWAQTPIQDDAAFYADYLSHLRAVPWQSPAGRMTSDNAWALELARLTIEGGDRTKTKALLDRADQPYVWLSVAQDRRFAALWPEFEAEGRFDWIKLQTAALETLRERARAEPKLLIHVTGQIDALRALGRYDEALALGEDYARRFKAREAFDDAEDQRAWVLNGHAYTLFDLGRYADADKVMAEADGDDQVSQRINRAELLIDAGQAARALKVLDSVKEKNSSPYGLMWRDASRACAKAQLGDLTAARAQAQAMAPRWKENGAALTKALVCAEQADEAAALYVRRLDDPATRAETLEAFRTGRAPPNETELHKAFRGRLAAVQARPEVQAALGRWGRPLTTPLGGTYWGSI